MLIDIHLLHGSLILKTIYFVKLGKTLREAKSKLFFAMKTGLDPKGRYIVS